MKMEGYHNTNTSKVEQILANGFICEYSDKHYLGQGFYFFSDIDTALINIDMLMHTEEISTIAVEIDVPLENYLNLDDPRNLNSFLNYWNQGIQELKKAGKELVKKNVSDKTAWMTSRCLFLDMYKKEKNYKVISKTFAKESPPYAVTLDDISRTGLSFLEKYICVSDNEYIVKKNLVEKELLI